MNRVSAIAISLLSLLTGLACAQSYPSRPVKIIVPFGPGSGSDIVARRLAGFLQERWKQPVIIDNRPGAQGVIGTAVLKNATPDGYTLGITTNSTHAAAQHLVRKLPYEPLKDFEHIALIGVGGSVALVRRDSPFKSLSQLAVYAKAHPGTVFFGHADTISQVPGELLKVAGFPIDGVPYKSSANVVTDLIGGQIQLAFFNYMTGAVQVRNGRLIPIAVTEGYRNAHWAGVPAVNETVPGFEVTLFVGLSAPRGIPAEFVQTVYDSVQAAQLHPDVKEPLEGVGLRFVRQSPGEYRGLVQNEAARWREHVRAARIEAQ